MSGLGGGASGGEGEWGSECERGGCARGFECERIGGGWRSDQLGWRGWRFRVGFEVRSAGGVTLSLSLTDHVYALHAASYGRARQAVARSTRDIMGHCIAASR